MSEFFRMDGYAAYVWPSYAIALTVLLLNVFWTRRSLRQAQEEARRRLAMAASGPQARQGVAGESPGDPRS